MNSDPLPPVFLQLVSLGLAQLKQKLQHHYEQAYPNLREIIRLVLEQEEVRAWQLSPFPHLIFPDLVEAHVAKLNLEPATLNDSNIVTPHRFEVFPSYQQALALCG